MNQSTQRASRVLVVDDNAFCLVSETALLQRLGHQVVTAGNAYDALKHLANTPIDLVITDIEMPYIRGDELSFLIHHYYPNLPIYVLTSAQREELNILKEAKLPYILDKQRVNEHIGCIIEHFNLEKRLNS